MPSLAQISSELLHKHNLRLKKSLGQHLLTDPGILHRIIAAADLSKKDLVIEVGTGLGILTRELAEKAGRVVSIELDEKLLEAAKDYLKDCRNIEFIRNDILKVDLPSILKHYKKYKIVANLPYYITSPIIAKILEAKPRPSLIVLTVQREVAERLIAKPGGKDYGAFTIFVQYHTQPEIYSYVPKSAFLPQPEVGSAIIVLRPRLNPPVKVDEKLFFEVVRAAFQQRRKTLRNALRNASSLESKRDGIDAALAEAEIDPNRRGETLSLEEFGKIAYFSAKNG